MDAAIKTKWLETKWKDLILVLIKGFLSFVLLYAGLAKLWNPESTQAYVYVLDWLPISITLFVLEILPWVEIVVAIAVWLKPIERPALWVMTGLFFLFFVLAIYGNVMGWAMDCSCFGDQFETTFNKGMIVRNHLFFIFSIIILKGYK